MRHIKAGEAQLVLLSRRETQVLALVRLGHENKEIAYELHIAESSVKSHISHMTAALRLRNRVQLCSWALTHPAVFRGDAVTAAHELPPVPLVA